MLITKTPLRVSFFGGGSDLPQYYEHTDGLVISTAIDSFIYLAVNRCVANHLKVIYSKLELVNDVDDVEHNRVREALKFFELESNLEICSFSDVPVKGTGLGSSSTFTVGLINAFYYIKYGRHIDMHELADIACFIEINRCAEMIGKQDQFAATYGGFNQYRFRKDGVDIEPVHIDPSTKIGLENRLLFFNTGISRSAADILHKQAKNTKTGVNVENIGTLVDMAEQGLKYLKKSKLHDFGKLLHESWLLKKKLSDGITNNVIDEMYDIGTKAGAIGGKILGAGGGGYMMLYVPMSKKNAVIDAMHKYERRNFRFYSKGSVLESIT